MGKGRLPLGHSGRRCLPLGFASSTGRDPFCGSPQTALRHPQLGIGSRRGQARERVSAILLSYVLRPLDGGDDASVVQDAIRAIAGARNTSSISSATPSPKNGRSDLRIGPGLLPPRLTRTLARNHKRLARKSIANLALRVCGDLWRCWRRKGERHARFEPPRSTNP